MLQMCALTLSSVMAPAMSRQVSRFSAGSGCLSPVSPAASELQASAESCRQSMIPASKHHPKNLRETRILSRALRRLSAGYSLPPSRKACAASTVSTVPTSSQPQDRHRIGIVLLTGYYLVD
ncbi:hypothetical protein B0T16DRAFT_56638 [Cercophora newfieldiana]|uniref:Uncharacterized protein n=1 Tax=Cercophora newfieldiana TaxID=92897 RepID=A0AA39YRG4_9PEZI|nr:hypothetical protein B0T16DRAFT_56638 [Cercophora newfieldiana]